MVNNVSLRNKNMQIVEYNLDNRRCPLHFTTTTIVLSIIFLVVAGVICLVYLFDYSLIDIIKPLVRINYCESAEHLSIEHQCSPETIKNVKTNLNPETTKYMMPLQDKMNVTSAHKSITSDHIPPNNRVKVRVRYSNTHYVNYLNQQLANIANSQKLPKGHINIADPKLVHELIQTNNKIPLPADIIGSDTFKYLQRDAYNYNKSSYEFNQVKDSIRERQFTNSYQSEEQFLEDYHNFIHKHLESQLNYELYMERFDPSSTPLEALVNKDNMLFYKTNNGDNESVYVEPRVFLTYKVNLQEIHNQLYSINTDMKHPGTLYFPDINWHNYVHGIDELTPLCDLAYQSSMPQELHPPLFNEKYKGLNVLGYYNEQKYRGFSTPVEELYLKYSRNIDAIYHRESLKHTLINQLPVQHELKSMTLEDWGGDFSLFNRISSYSLDVKRLKLDTMTYFDTYIDSGFQFDPTIFETSGYTRGDFKAIGEGKSRYYQDEYGYTYTVQFDSIYNFDSNINRAYILNKKEYLNNYNCNNKEYLKRIEYCMNKAHKNSVPVRLNALHTPETNYIYSRYSHYVTINDIRRGIQASKNEPYEI